jgi:hypothetical protein
MRHEGPRPLRDRKPELLPTPGRRRRFRAAMAALGMAFPALHTAGVALPWLLLTK